MSEEELLEELYLMLLSRGSGQNLEFWDPTLDAIILLEEVLERMKRND